MNRISKTMRKGFTLVELMVVMAIMSILLLAVMSMTTPTSRMFRRTAVSDNVYSAGDNITGYLRRTLEYADNVWILDSNEPEAADEASLKKAAFDFMQCYYKNVIKGSNAGEPTGLNTHFVKGKVHILELNNTDGQIYETVYGFSASNASALDSTPVKAKQAVLNPSYFSGDYADYYFRYLLGATTLEAEKKSSGEFKMDGTEIIYAVKAEKDGDTVKDSLKNSAITLVACKGDSAPAIPTGGSYYEFTGPCVASVANLPFTNISSRNNGVGNLPVSRLINAGDAISKDKIHSQNELIAGYTIGYERTPSNIVSGSYANLASGNKISFVTEGTTPTVNNIYFIFSYADELQ